MFHLATPETSTGTYEIEVTTQGERAVLEAPAVQTAALAADEQLTINGVTIKLTANMSQDEVIETINHFTSQSGVVADNGGTGGATRLYTEAFGSTATLSVHSNIGPAAGASSEFATSTATDAGVDIAGTIGGITFRGNGNLATGTTGPIKGITVSVNPVDESPAGSPELTATGVLGNVTVTDNSLVFQIGANQHQTGRVSVSKFNTVSLGLNTDSKLFKTLNDIDVTSANKSQEALPVIDAAIDDITEQRGLLGAFQQNTLESTVNNLRTTLENTVNAESVIRDTDFALEIANFTKHQVLVQAGTSVLGNANQISQLVLALLQ